MAFLNCFVAFQIPTLIDSGCTTCLNKRAVASIARDDPSTLPGDDPFPRAH